MQTAGAVGSTADAEVQTNVSFVVGMSSVGGGDRRKSGQREIPPMPTRPTPGQDRRKQRAKGEKVVSVIYEF